MKASAKDALIKQLQTLLEVNAYRVWSGSLDGAISANKTYQRINRPKVGDLVMEITAIGRRSPKDISNIGRLTRIVDQSGHDVVDPAHRHDVTFHLTTLEGRDITWSNAKFVKVFETMFDPIEEADA